MTIYINVCFCVSLPFIRSYTIHPIAMKLADFFCARPRRILNLYIHFTVEFEVYYIQSVFGLRLRNLDKIGKNLIQKVTFHLSIDIRSYISQAFFLRFPKGFVIVIKYYFPYKINYATQTTSVGFIYTLIKNKKCITRFRNMRDTESKHRNHSSTPYYNTTHLPNFSQNNCWVVRMKNGNWWIHFFNFCEITATADGIINKVSLNIA